MRSGSEAAVRGWPHGERRERSRWEMEGKQVGTMKRSRRLPRRVRAERVARSRRYHLRQTRAAELRVRTSETAAMMLERRTSGRSLRVVVP